MSLIGQIATITVTRTAPSTLVLNSLHFTEFTHEAAVVSTSSVVKDDISNTVNDVYVVKVSNPFGSIPATTATIANWVTTATSAITAQFGANELL